LRCLLAIDDWILEPGLEQCFLCLPSICKMYWLGPQLFFYRDFIFNLDLIGLLAIGSPAFGRQLSDSEYSHVVWDHGVASVTGTRRYIKLNVSSATSRDHAWLARLEAPTLRGVQDLKFP
jgi:hypothetical protein